MKKRRNQSFSEPDATTKWREWLDHQNDPGYWTGGRFNPMVSVVYPYIFVFLGSCFLLAACIGLLSGKSHLSDVIWTIVGGGLFLTWGILLFRKQRRRPVRQQQRRKRKRRS